MTHRHNCTLNDDQDVGSDPVRLPDRSYHGLQLKRALSTVAQEKPHQAPEKLVDVSVLGLHGVLDAHVLLPGR